MPARAAARASSVRRSRRAVVGVQGLLEQRDAEDHAGDRVEGGAGRDGGRERAGVERHLVERHRGVADDHERVEVPVGEASSRIPSPSSSTTALVSAAREGEQDPGRDAQQRGAARAARRAGRAGSATRTTHAQAAPRDQPLAERRVVAAARGVGDRQERDQGGDHQDRGADVARA